MTNERWLQIEKVFNTVSGLPPEQRAATLDECCAGDAELRREVESLLACDAADDAFLRAPVEGAAAQVSSQRTSAIIGKRLGAWRITGVLGHGGMGTVYRAVRDDGQYEQAAAVKLLRYGLATEADLRRFRRERQILARLEHPHIARLVDGGATEEGLPYLVMEYVEGESITAFCRDRSLPVSERLRLFRDVCATVQYAHQSLVIHRDLKPSNILVTTDGHVKLLDFGIAKLLDPDLHEDELALTSGTAWMLTPDYASPEQVRGQNITAATDIYSLGAILYELLTGGRPHEIKGRSAADVERAICEQEIQLPSTVARSRSLRGDLDTIVLKAMSKEPARRYSSVERLSEDIERHLAGLPVRARRDTAFYRAGKFVRRNRWLIAIGAAATAGLLAATTVAILQAARAQRQIVAVRDLATTMLIDVNEKVRMLPGSVDARIILVNKGLLYLDRLGREAGQDPVLLWDLARGYEKVAALQASPDPAEPNLLQFEKGLDAYKRALAFAKAVERTRSMDQELLLLLCRIHIGIGGNSPPPIGISHLQESLRLNAMLGPGTPRYFGPKGPDAKEYLGYLAHALHGRSLQESNPTEALRLFRKSGPLLTKPHIPAALENLGDLRGALSANEDHLQSVRLLQSEYPAEDIRKRIMRLTEFWAELHQATMLGGPHSMNMDNEMDAMTVCRRVLPQIDAMLTRDPTDGGVIDTRLTALTDLGSLLAANQPLESVKAYQEVLASTSYPGRIPFLKQIIIKTRWQICYPLLRLGKNEEARQHAIKAVEESPTAQAYLALADSQIAMGMSEEALTSFRLAQKTAENRASETPKYMRARAELAEVYEKLARFHEGKEQWQVAHDFYSKAHGLWANWTASGGVMNPFVVRKEREIAQAVARCSAKIQR